jgi:integrase
MARGSIAKRPGRNGTYWRLRARDTSGAVREIRLLWVDRTGKIITTLADAQDRLGELVGELQGPPPTYVGRDKRRIRFVEVADEWLSVHPNAWAKEEYEALLKSRILPALGDVPIAELTKIRLQQFVQEFAAAPETLRKSMLVIRSVLDHAIDRNLIARNPTRGVKRPKVERRSLHIWSPEQVTLFLNAFPPAEFKWRVFCEVLFYAGLRFGEAVALTPGQVKADTLIVSHSWNAKHKTLKPPKSGRARSVDLHPTLKRDLLSYLERSGVPRDGILFPRPDGERLDGSWFTRNIWDPTIKQAGLPRIRVHDARHTCVAHLLEAGENPVYVKEQAGHTSAAFTLDRYGHLIPSRNRTRRDVGKSVPGESRAAD